LQALIALSLVQGCGFGIVVVTGVSAVAELTPATKWGKGLGLYGAAVGVAGIIGSPSGLWIADRAGFDWAFIAGAVPTAAVLAGACGATAIRPAPRK